MAKRKLGVAPTEPFLHPRTNFCTQMHPLQNDSCNRIWELVNLRNDTQHYQEGFFVYDIPTFNERVVREAVLNAVSHRNYQMVGSVFIRQYRDKLVIASPGGLPNGISLDNILDRQVPRNRRIAEILSLCGLVEHSGQGINLMYEISIMEAKQLPDFTGTDGASCVMAFIALLAFIFVLPYRYFRFLDAI